MKSCRAEELREIRSFAVLLLCALAAACSAGGSQTADLSFSIQASDPAYLPGQGPVVLVDAGHHNFHTAQGRYKPFADLLRSDGYQVRSFHSRFEAPSLKSGRILVISNALSERNAPFEDWGLPTYPAFEKDEVEAVTSWVERGGALLLIADHMPMPGAAADLAAAFGVRFTNGYAIHEKRQNPRPPLKFRRPGDSRPSDGLLRHHPILRGRKSSEGVSVVATFTGQAFQSDHGDPILVFGPSIISLQPQQPAVFTDETPRVAVEGWYQGLAMRYGEGRAAFFGEAAMFTAQLSGGDRPMGMNSPQAPENAQFLLNLMHWLSGLLEE
ncbi:MAG: DUF4350 domain-containing protein [Acidobacteriota bacterium]